MCGETGTIERNNKKKLYNSISFQAVALREKLREKRNGKFVGKNANQKKFLGLILDKIFVKLSQLYNELKSLLISLENVYVIFQILTIGQVRL